MGWKIRIRQDEACEDPAPFLTPDLVMTQNIGPALAFDYALAEPDEANNRMGLTAKRGLHTAVILQLFCDRRLRADMAPLDDLDPDPRGWWGDTVDLREDMGERQIGSHLWTLRRAPLVDETLRRAEEYCREALQPLIDQGAVARFDVVCEGQFGGAVDPTSGLLAIKIDGYSREGSRQYAQHFEVLWDQVATLARQGTR